MSDSLRDRIAAVIYNTSDEYSRKLMVRPDCPGASDMEGSGKPVCYVLADAVIRELGLREETNYVYFMTEGFGGSLKPGNNRRYVTEWETE